MSTTARIDELRKKFEENPRRYFAPLANEYRKSGELAQAIALCREHLPKQPGHMSGYIVFGQALYEAGDLVEARAVFEQALDLDPENLIALRHLGDIADLSGDRAGARRWYARVLDADPRNDDIAARLAGLAATGRTPVSSPAVVPSYDAIARMSETPAAGLGAIGLGTTPTPDSVLRAVDVDAFSRRVPHHSPIDLDAIPESAVAGSATSANVPDATVAPTENGAESAPAEARPVEPAIAPSPEARDVREVPAEAPIAEESEDTDPFGFPAASAEAMGRLSSAENDATYGDVVMEPSADEFEEGLAAPQWPDTADLVSRIVTPRSFTPPAVATHSDDALDDAVRAFGREAHDPQPSAQAPEDAYTPVVEATPVDATPVEATPVEAQDAAAEPRRESPRVEAAEDERVDAEPEVSGWADAVVAHEENAPAIAGASETAPEDAFDGDTSHGEVAHEGNAYEPSAAYAEADSDAHSEAHSDVHAETSLPEAEALVESHDVSPEFAHAHDLSDAEESDDVHGAGEMVAGAFTADEPTDTPATPLPWIAGAESVESMQPVSYNLDEPGEPGLEEILEAFAEDARSAGEERPLSIAALDEAVHRTPSAGAPAFVTETMAELLVSQGFVGRAVDVYEELVRRRPYDPVLSTRLAELKATLAASEAAPLAEVPAVPEAEYFAEPVAAQEGAAEAEPMAESAETAFVVDARDWDAVSDQHVDIVVEVEEVAEVDVVAAYEAASQAQAFMAPAAVSPEDMFAAPTESLEAFEQQLDNAVNAAETDDPWAHAPYDETDVADATADATAEAAAESQADVTPAYGTPALGTPAFGTSAFGTSMTDVPADYYDTPLSAALVTPAVAPYAQPALEEELRPRRSARDWFAALAARRVPRRTPAAASPAVDAPSVQVSAPEGLALLFGADTASNDDAAAQALADAFAPVSAEDLESGATLDFEYARSTPAFSPVMTSSQTPPRAASATPAFTPPPSAAQGTAAGQGDGNAGFAFDKFFPDPAVGRGTPAASPPDAPVTDDLAQFSAWLKGLGNT